MVRADPVPGDHALLKGANKALTPCQERLRHRANAGFAPMPLFVASDSVQHLIY
jgi:hypothetical protein